MSIEGGLTFGKFCTNIIVLNCMLQIRRERTLAVMDENKSKPKRKPSVIPIYAVGAVWLLSTDKLGSLRGIISCAVTSLIVYAVLRVIFPGKKLPPEAEQPQPEQKPAEPVKTAPQPEQKPEEPANAAPQHSPELQAVIEQGKTTVARIRQLNDEIPDERMSAQIDLIERLAAQIFDCVQQHPEKLGQIRQFLNYYLPTTIKLMEQYVTLQNQSVKTGNIEEGMRRIETLLDKVIVAFQQQLDALFEADVVDITADIRVMEQMMASEGLTGKKDFV